MLTEISQFVRIFLYLLIFCTTNILIAQNNIQSNNTDLTLNAQEQKDDTTTIRAKKYVERSLQDYFFQPTRAGYLGKHLGLSFSFSSGFAVDIFGLSRKIAVIAGFIGKIQNDESFYSGDAEEDISFAGIDAKGSATTLVGPDFNLLTEYDIPHTPLFVRAGFSYTYALPIEFTGKGDIQSDILGDNPTYIDIAIRYEGYQLEVPFVIGLNLLKIKASTVYFGFGANWSYSFIKYSYESNSTFDLQPDSNNNRTQGVGLSNVQAGYGIGLLYIVGASVRVYKYLDLFAELKVFSGSGKATIYRPKSGDTTYLGLVAQYLFPQIEASGIDNNGVLLPYPGNDQLIDIQGNGNESRIPSQEAYIVDLSYLRFNFGVKFHL